MKKIPLRLQRILDRARWAPSGDNTQPWRFEVLGEDHVLVHGYDTRDRVVYDLDGHASQLAVGGLLETIQIAASAESCLTYVTRRPATPDTHLQFDVRFKAEKTISPDPLSPFIEKRVVQRRPMSTHPLNEEQKADLAKSMPAGYEVQWFEGIAQRWRLAKLTFDNAKVRLIIPEAYEVHKSVIEWGRQYSTDKIPAEAVGVDAVTARFMRWVMTDWKRVNFFNTWLMGHLPPRIQLDLLPGMACAGHFALFAPSPLLGVDDYLASGRAMQRFWLTATRLGLFIQPEMTPLIFSRYCRQGIRFTRVDKALEIVNSLNARLIGILDGRNPDTLFFMGRLGFGPAPQSRSTRQSLDRLMVDFEL